MALSSAIVWEVRSTATANNANGGGFKAGASGTDWSKQDAAQYNLSGATSAAANAIILHASAAADMVGNVAHVISGTNATPGWYEITAVSAGVSITVDRNWGTGAVASGVVNIGGAISLNSATVNQADSDFGNAIVAGNTIYIKGSPTLGANLTVAAGASGTPTKIYGYQTIRGDNPTGANRPTITCGAFTFNHGGSNICQHLIFTGSAANVFTHAGGVGGYVSNCKITNTSTTAGRVALNLASGSSTTFDCEAISYRGIAAKAANSFYLSGCYLHDSDIGLQVSGSTFFAVQSCIIESNVTKAFDVSGAVSVPGLITGCTLYGSEGKTGTGLAIVGTANAIKLFNNIIYGFVTGINDSAGAGVNYGDYNCLANNTTNYTGFTAGAHDVTSSPSLTGVAQITGSTATTSGSVLTQAGADFSTVTDNRDFCYIASGTGITAGQYLITAHTTTTLTLDIAPGTSAVGDKVFQVTTGRNFQPQAIAVKQVGFPHAFQAGLTSSFVDIGASQRDGDQDQPSVVDVRAAVSYDLGTKIGTLLGGKKNLGTSIMG